MSRWTNWSGNLEISLDKENYVSPATLSQLQAIVTGAATKAVVLRVSGQRHSQAPLVVADGRGGTPAEARKTLLIDLSCYADLGPNRDQRIVLEPSGRHVTVNAGVREDELDAFLTAHHKMFRTVTAGGFFSVGGMTAVDVHGATVDAPIFAETASAFTIMGLDGTVTTIDEDTPSVAGWKPIQFARVSLGALGIVTSVTLEVVDRPWATTLKSGSDTYSLNDEAAFVSQFKAVLKAHERIETFVNPYTNKFLVLWWDVDPSPATKTPLQPAAVPDPCVHARKDEFGAALSFIDPIAQPNAQLHQSDKLGPLGVSLAHTDVQTCFSAIETQFENAKKKNKELWLEDALRVMFMSYFIELPAFDDAGLGKAWRGLQAVSDRLRSSNKFQLVAPLEFRFVRGGDSALAGTYTRNAGSAFVNLDMIGYVPAAQASKYPPELLHFFADIERAWVGLGGMPHHGKMYGFYDPAGADGSFTAPFNANFLKDLASSRRRDQIGAFESFRRQRDSDGIFCNHFLGQVLGH
ncbi:MAG: D-arabinono-1,4-lactone oxidase [Bryobacteraceae bacterium]